MDLMKLMVIATALVLVQACSHPIEIVGHGDVISASGSRNCLLEDYQAGLDNCSKNLTVGAYQETYYPLPRAGWKFDHWVTYCANAAPPYYDCSFDIPAPAVQNLWGKTVPPLKAVFTLESSNPITDTVFVGGKEWAQVELFTDLSWDDINAVCPGGKCAGDLKGYDLNGWTWASLQDVHAMFNFYLASNEFGDEPMQYGEINSSWGPLVFGTFRPTEENLPDWQRLNMILATQFQFPGNATLATIVDNANSFSYDAMTTDQYFDNTTRSWYWGALFYRSE